MLWLTHGDGFTTTDWSLAGGWKISLKIRKNKNRQQEVEVDSTDGAGGGERFKSKLLFQRIEGQIVRQFAIAYCVDRSNNLIMCGLPRLKWDDSEESKEEEEKQVVGMLTRPQFLAQMERFIPVERRSGGQPGSGNWILAKVWDAMDPKMRWGRKGLWLSWLPTSQVRRSLL